MFNAKSRPDPTNQESNTLLWPVDLRFWFCLMLMGHCRWISTHLSSLFLSFSPFPMDQGLSRSSKSLLCKSLSPQQALCCMICLSQGDSPAPGSIAQIPAWVYFKASSLCTVHRIISPSLPTGRALIMPSTTSFPPAFFFFRNLVNVHLAWKGDSWFPRTKSDKILGFFGTKKLRKYS